jgi:hypothetical protein
MNRNLISAMGLLMAASGARANLPAEISFDRYQVILDRKPFGSAPVQEVAVAPLPQPDSFAKRLRLSTIIEVNDGSMKIGFIDTGTGKNYMLQPGESLDGIEVVSGSWEDEEAILKQGAEMALIKLASGTVEAITAADQQRRQADQGSRADYQTRRRMRAQPEPPPEPPQPKYSGEELQKHLENYQLEVIRQGLPPLPIPLTPEMDRQLIQEGILPPQ